MSYGDTILEEIEQRDTALRSASERYATLKTLTSDNAAFDKDHLSRTLFNYHLLFGSQHSSALSGMLRQEIEQFASLAEANEISLLDSTPPSVADALREMNRVKQVELLLLEILNCIVDAGTPIDRDSVDDFVAALFSAPI